MRNTAKSMVKKGITTFVDFRESGLDGVLLIQKGTIWYHLFVSVILGKNRILSVKKYISKKTHQFHNHTFIN